MSKLTTTILTREFLLQLFQAHAKVVPNGTKLVQQGVDFLCSEEDLEKNLEDFSAKFIVPAVKAAIAANKGFGQFGWKDELKDKSISVETYNGIEVRGQMIENIYTGKLAIRFDYGVET